MRCGSCRYWGKPDEAALKWRTCTAVVHDKQNSIPADDPFYRPIEERDWLSEEVKREMIAIRDSAVAVVQDGSGWRAALKCRDSFGCVLYEANT